MPPMPTASAATKPRKSRPRTLSRGADDERSAWMQKLRRERQFVAANKWLSANALLDRLESFGAGRSQRNAVRTGGLPGRRKA